MKYTLGQAAKATGKAKGTISNAIKQGRLSAQKNDKGEYEIDAAELAQVLRQSSEAFATECLGLRSGTRPVSDPR